MASNRIFLIASGLTVLAVAAGAFLTLNHAESDAASQATDDAYVQADFTVLSPRISGVVSALLVEENQPVRAGTPLLQLDPRDLQVALDSTRAQVASAQATILSLQAQIARQDSAQRQARATLEGGEAQLALAEANNRRFANLARDGSGTQQAQQQAEAQLRLQTAGRERDQAALLAVGQQSAVLQADLAKARAGLALAQAAQAAAELNLGYTRIAAPVDGIIAQRSARVGAFVSPGKPLLTLVPLDAVYIEANLRETQLARVRVGQPVQISVDALPGLRLSGHVQSLAPASGVSFSALPAHNATGNFTKIVQRLPVRISLDPGQAAARQLRVGMSVRPEIAVREGA